MASDLSPETIAYLAQYNTNPECAGVGVIGVGNVNKRYIVLIVYCIVAFLILASSVWYMYMRQHRRRLAIRSLNPIVMGSVGSAICLLIRAAYDFVGREHLTCGGSLTLFYLFFLLNVIPDNILVTSFLAKQGFRSKFNAAMLYGNKEGAVHPESMRKPGMVSTRMASSRAISDVEGGNHAASVVVESATASVTRCWRTPMACWIAFGLEKVATPAEWFKGFWNHFLTISDTTSFASGGELKFHSRWRFREVDATNNVSPLRELSYDMLVCLLMSGSLIFAWALRLILVPVYNPANDCTGCNLFWQDYLIVLGAIGFLFLLQTLVLWRTRNVLDPLKYRRDLGISMVLSCIAAIGYILAIVDPGDLMKKQVVDWFFFEGIAMVAMHWHRCITQLVRVSKFHKERQQDLKLIDILQGDPRGAILFEKYLMGELASENLLFWREGIKYKMNFGADFDYAQQAGRVLYRTFVSKHAQLPINISGELRETIENRFRSGFIGRNVFDEALVEIYQMMQNGPFERFVQSNAFKDYANSKGDFSLPVSSAAAAQLQVVPSPSPLSTPHSSNLGAHPHVEEHHHGLAGRPIVSTSAYDASTASKGAFSISDYIKSLT